jgi:hypothetical protein
MDAVRAAQHFDNHGKVDEIYSDYAPREILVRS